MAFYQDREEFFDGNVVVFRRADTSSKQPFYQCRLKIDGMKGYARLSLKTRSRDDAVGKAKAAFHDLTQRVKDGGSVKNRTFDQAWQAWYAAMVAEGAWSADRQKWHLNYFNRYFQAYFGGKRLDEITAEFANDYWSWRRRYWVDGPGIEQVTYNRRRKGLKSHSTHNAKKQPAYKTLAMEQSALNQFFDWCYSKKRYFRYPIKLKVTAPARSKNEGRRPTFDSAEWTMLTRNLLSWAKNSGKHASQRLNVWHLHQRQQLRFYVLFLAGTGIRSGTETRFMRWEDIKFRDEGDLAIRIRSNTKRGISRVVISQPNCVAWMREWQNLSRYAGHQDLVWYGTSKTGEKQQPTTDLNKTFQAFLKSVEYKGRTDGLLNDADGKRRSLYSLRHFYATQRLKQGVSYEDLRRNMGTGIKQLVAHYDWATTEQRAAAITKTSFGKKREFDPDAMLASLTADQKEVLRKRL